MSESTQQTLPFPGKSASHSFILHSFPPARRKYRHVSGRKRPHMRSRPPDACRILIQKASLLSSREHRSWFSALTVITWKKFRLVEKRRSKVGTGVFMHPRRHLETAAGSIWMSQRNQRNEGSLSQDRYKKSMCYLHGITQTRKCPGGRKPCSSKQAGIKDPPRTAP